MKIAVSGLSLACVGVMIIFTFLMRLALGSVTVMTVV
jgi:hypothetical protein